ncbi:MAG: hypothetical protein DBX91_11775 [Subdoligranulum variabile]|nr:MAG: hypothetical protein DBX91_11775 [Subdoligranulum variabile]
MDQNLPGFAVGLLQKQNARNAAQLLHALVGPERGGGGHIVVVHHPPGLKVVLDHGGHLPLGLFRFILQMDVRKIRSGHSAPPPFFCVSV